VFNVRSQSEPKTFSLSQRVALYQLRHLLVPTALSAGKWNAKIPIVKSSSFILANRRSGSGSEPNHTQALVKKKKRSIDRVQLPREKSPTVIPICLARGIEQLVYPRTDLEESRLPSSGEKFIDVINVMLKSGIRRMPLLDVRPQLAMLVLQK